MYISDIEIERMIFRSLDVNALDISIFSQSEHQCVYDIKTQKGHVVLRVSSPDRFDYLKGSVYWLETLKREGVRVPDVLYVNDSLEDFKYYFIIIERLDGYDLGYVYPELSTDSKRNIAEKVVSIQNKVSKITKSIYPGRKFLPTDKLKNQTWYDYISDITEIAENLEDKSLFDFGKIYQFESKILKYKDLLNKVEIKGYLDGLTVKNVMIHKGDLTGIVDIDYFSYGDVIMSIALTKMQLLKADYDLHYVDFWCYEMGLTEDQFKLLDLYTLRYCLEFMSVIGQKDDLDEKIKYKPEIDRLNRLFDMIKKKI